MLALRVRRERWKEPHVMWHEKERLQEGHRKESRQCGIKQHILLFTCQTHADTKTKQNQGASLGLYPGRHCLLASATCQPITAIHARWGCRLPLFPFSEDSQVKPLHTGPSRQGLHVKGRPLIDTYQSAGRTIFQIRLIISTYTFFAKFSRFYILQNCRDLL